MLSEGFNPSWGWFVVVDYVPHPDTLRYISMFALVRELAAITVCTKRDIDQLCGLTSLEEAMRISNGYKGESDSKGKFVSRVCHVLPPSTSRDI